MEKRYQRTFGSFTTALTILLLFSSVLQNAVFAQKEKNIWYFGGGSVQGATSASGIDFNTSPPTLLATSGMYSNEGSAVMSDKATGALLFYTNGTTIYNNNHQPMANGTGLNGNTSATQSSLIIPVPCSTTKYYVFTMYSQAIIYGLSYSIVDMTLNGGLGGVTTKNTSISSQFVTEKLTAIKHANGQDYWLIYHTFPNCPPFNVQATSSQFNVRLINSTGVGAATPYNAGTPYIDLGNAPSNQSTIGYLRPSHDCKMLAAAIGGMGVVDVLNFNNATGAISSKYSFDPGHTIGYGMEFSPDNTKLYFSTGNGATSNTGVLAQFDLSSGVSATIGASKQTIFSYTSPAQGGGGALLLAPDGKIYFARTDNPGLNYLSVINNPDAAGAACNFVQQGFMLGAKFSSLGLPNFLQEGCSSDTLIADFDTLTACVGQPSSFVTQITGTLGGGATFAWSFGDGGFSNVQNPTHIYTSAGQYLVTLTIEDGCKKIVIQKKITITGTLAPTIAGNTTICPGGVATLTASGSSSYAWNTGQTTASISVSPATSTTYSVSASSGGCSGTASVTVTVGGALSPVIAGNTTICSGQTTTLTVSGGNTYSWSNGATTNSIIVSPGATTSYSVLASSGGCLGTTSVTVTVGGSLSPAITGNTTICPGQFTTLTASGGTGYSWSTGETTNSIIVSPGTTTTYSVVASAGGCSGTTSETVTVNSGTTPVITGSTLICTGDIATLTASGGSSYSWSNGATTASITVSPAATTNYSVSVTGSCSGTASTTLVVTNAITAAIACQDVCGSNSATLVASGGGPGGSYLWSNGSATSAIIVSPATTTSYTVIVGAGSSCADTTDCTVNVFPGPTVSAASDTTIETGGIATLTATGSGTYAWNNGSTGAVISVSPTVTTQYAVTVIDANGCTAIAYVTVTVDDPCNLTTVGELYVPNAFSPNGDQENDELQIYYGNFNCLESITLTIYNRWGEKVFSAEGGPTTAQQTARWDGTYKGKPLASATFIYYFNATLITGEKIVKKGNISLMK